VQPPPSYGHYHDHISKGFNFKEDRGSLKPLILQDEKLEIFFLLDNEKLFLGLLAPVSIHVDSFFTPPPQWPHRFECDVSPSPPPFSSAVFLNLVSC